MSWRTMARRKTRRVIISAPSLRRTVLWNEDRQGFEGSRGLFVNYIGIMACLMNWPGKNYIPLDITVVSSPLSDHQHQSSLSERYLENTQRWKQGGTPFIARWQSLINDHTLHAQLAATQRTKVYSEAPFCFSCLMNQIRHHLRSLDWLCWPRPR